jgi:hypothetical protein
MPVAEATFEADEYDLVVRGLLDPLGDAAGGADRRTVVFVFPRAASFGHAPSVD